MLLTEVTLVNRKHGEARPMAGSPAVEVTVTWLGPDPRYEPPMPDATEALLTARHDGTKVATRLWVTNEMRANAVGLDAYLRGYAEQQWHKVTGR